jgi:hypothetical protein
MASSIPPGPEGADARLWSSQYQGWRESYGEVGADGEFLRARPAAGVAVEDVVVVAIDGEVTERLLSTGVAAVAEQRTIG